MPKDYRDTLFKTYQMTHGKYVDSVETVHSEWFLEYVKANYLKHLKSLNLNSAQILEIGCSKGYLLASLASFGFQKLSGVDLSPDDVEIAGKRVPIAVISCEDALPYLETHANTFDVIILKAVLEHTPKENIMPLLERIQASLISDGIVIIDVPNMDWLFANHERYMDFTHEVGFTRESLAQVMRNVFSNVVIYKAVSPRPRSIKGKIISFVRPVLIEFTTCFLKVLGDGAGELWWPDRGIIGIGRK